MFSQIEMNNIRRKIINLSSYILILFLPILFCFCQHDIEGELKVFLPNDGCGVYLIIPSKNSSDLSKRVEFDSIRYQLISYESINEFKSLKIKVIRDEKDVTAEAEIASAIISNNGNEVRFLRIELKCKNSQSEIEDLEIDYIINDLKIVQ